MDKFSTHPERIIQIEDQDEPPKETDTNDNLKKNLNDEQNINKIETTNTVNNTGNNFQNTMTSQISTESKSAALPKWRKPLEVPKESKNSDNLDTQKISIIEKDEIDQEINNEMELYLIKLQEENRNLLNEYEDKKRYLSNMMGSSFFEEHFPDIDTEPDKYINSKGKDTQKLVELRKNINQQLQLIEETEKKISAEKEMRNRPEVLLEKLRVEFDQLKNENNQLHDENDELKSQTKFLESEKLKNEISIKKLEENLREKEAQILRLNEELDKLRFRQTNFAAQEKVTPTFRGFSEFKFSQDLQSEHKENIVSLSTSPDGKFFASGSFDYKIELWKSKDINEDRFSKAQEENEANDRECHRALERNGSIPSFERCCIFTGHGHYVMSTKCFYLDNRNQTNVNVISGSRDGYIKLWNYRTSECTPTIEVQSHRSGVNGITLSMDCDRKCIASCGVDMAINLWTISNKSITLIRSFANAFEKEVLDISFCSKFLPENPVGAINPCQNHQMIVAIGRNQSNSSHVKLLDIESGKWIWAMDETHQGQFPFSHIVVSQCNNYAITSSSTDGMIKVWDLKSGNFVKDLSGHEVGVNQLALFQSEYLISSSKDKTVKIWNWKNGNCLKTLNGHSTNVSSVVVDPISANWIVSGGEGNDIMKLWTAL